MIKKINEKTAGRILTEIQKAKKILLALHVSPDPDSAASVLAMDLVLKRMRKKTQIISYGQLPAGILAFPGIEKVETADFSRLSLADFDLFIALDCAQKRMITRSVWPERLPAGFKIINIDHHLTNDKFGRINLVSLVSSTAELVYDLLRLWEVKIDQKLASLLFWGIVSDTGCFQYPNTRPQTLRTAADLIEGGASLNDCVLQEFRSYSFKTLKYWGRILDNMQMDESGRFVWSKITQAETRELGVRPTEIMAAASLFAPIILGTEFGIILHEEAEDLTRGSLRSRAEFDVSRLAQELGGGGHQQSAGFSLSLPLAEAEKKILETARKFIKN